MGTRAVIRFGDTRIATHWDGYPSSLGKDLLELDPRNLESVIEVAKDHTIDFASRDIITQLSHERFVDITNKANELAKSHKYNVADVEKEHKLTGKFPGSSMMSADDWPIVDFECYGDFAEYEYDVSVTQVRFRELSGKYDQAKQDKDNNWSELTPEIVNQKD